MGWGPVDWVGRVLPEPKFENKCTSFFEFFGFERPLLRQRGGPLSVTEEKEKKEKKKDWSWRILGSGWFDQRLKRQQSQFGRSGFLTKSRSAFLKKTICYLYGGQYRWAVSDIKCQTISFTACKAAPSSGRRQRPPLPVLSPLLLYRMTFPSHEKFVAQPPNFIAGNQWNQYLKTGFQPKIAFQWIQFMLGREHL